MNATEDGSGCAAPSARGRRGTGRRSGSTATARGSGAAGARRRGRGGGAGGDARLRVVRGAGRPGAGQRHGLAHVAQAAGHAETARRLAALGAPLDAILAYELDGAAGLAGVALDEPIGRLGGTVLHEAVRIRDLDLLRAALAAGADTAARDRTYGADALEWAGHLHNPEAAELLTR